MKLVCIIDRAEVTVQYQLTLVSLWRAVHLYPVSTPYPVISPIMASSLSMVQYMAGTKVSSSFASLGNPSCHTAPSHLRLSSVPRVVASASQANGGDGGKVSTKDDQVAAGEGTNRREVLAAIAAGSFILPASSAVAGALPETGEYAKDGNGKDIFADKWLATHAAGDRAVARGLDGEATYLVVETDGTLASYGINAICTHMGCVVPWVAAENKFMCPCHGSQYDNQGKVVQGPAPLSLALAHVDVVDGKVVFSEWPETDFRTGEEPWWME